MDGLVRELLFQLACWHALAKLRIHTEHTLEDLTQMGLALCATVRRWMREMCDNISTKELKKEAEARARRQAQEAPLRANTSTTGQRLKTFNWNIYKAHRITDYPDAIRQFGTTEGYSTWRVSPPFFLPFPLAYASHLTLRAQSELEHRSSKRRFIRTNKHNWMGQIVRHEQRERFIASNTSALSQRAERRVQALQRRKKIGPESLPKGLPEDHYQIAVSRKDFVDIAEFLTEHEGDPGLEARLFFFLLSII
jgi:hypothetical protein